MTACAAVRVDIDTDVAVGAAVGVDVDTDVAVGAAVGVGVDTDVTVGSGADVGVGPEVGRASSPQAAENSRSNTSPQKTGTSPGLTLAFTGSTHKGEAGVCSTIHKFPPRRKLMTVEYYRDVLPISTHREYPTAFAIDIGEASL